MRNFGWTYEYLLWGISWLNIQMMIADAPRTEELEKDEFGNVVDDTGTPPVALKSKDDIKNFLKGMM